MRHLLLPARTGNDPQVQYGLLDPLLAASREVIDRFASGGVGRSEHRNKP
jgi:hypothetical protein